MTVYDWSKKILLAKSTLIRSSLLIEHQLVTGRQTQTDTDTGP